MAEVLAAPRLHGQALLQYLGGSIQNAQTIGTNKMGAQSVPCAPHYVLPDHAIRLDGPVGWPGWMARLDGPVRWPG